MLDDKNAAKDITQEMRKTTHRQTTLIFVEDAMAGEAGRQRDPQSNGAGLWRAQRLYFRGVSITGGEEDLRRVILRDRNIPWLDH